MYVGHELLDPLGPPPRVPPAVDHQRRGDQPADPLAAVQGLEGMLEDRLHVPAVARSLAGQPLPHLAAAENGYALRQPPPARAPGWRWWTCPNPTPLPARSPLPRDGHRHASLRMDRTLVGYVRPVNAGQLEQGVHAVTRAGAEAAGGQAAKVAPIGISSGSVRLQSSSTRRHRGAKDTRQRGDVRGSSRAAASGGRRRGAVASRAAVDSRPPCVPRRPLLDNRGEGWVRPPGRPSRSRMSGRALGRSAVADDHVGAVLEHRPFGFCQGRGEYRFRFLLGGNHVEAGGGTLTLRIDAGLWSRR